MGGTRSAVKTALILSEAIDNSQGIHKVASVLAPTDRHDEISGDPLAIAGRKVQRDVRPRAVASGKPAALDSCAPERRGKGAQICCTGSIFPV